MRTLRLFICSFFLVTFSHAAEIQTDIAFEDNASTAMDYSQEQTQQGYPFAISFEGFSVGDADFDEIGMDDEHLSFRSAHINARAAYLFDGCTGAFLQLGYRSDKITWDDNCHFGDNSFDFYTARVGVFTEKIEDWTWQAHLFASFDPDGNDTSHYSIYGIMLWGKYAYCDTVNIHLGFQANIGMKKEEVWPIIGFDYSPSCNWKINLVYPTNISAVYTFNDCWNASLAARFIKNRYRAPKEVYDSQIIEYRTTGVEGAITYAGHERFEASLFGGLNLGGDLKRRDKHGENPLFYRLKSAMYFGGKAELEF